MCFKQQWSHLKGKNKQISALGQMITRENNFIITIIVSFSCFHLSQQITTKEKNEESHITCQKVIFENVSNTEKWRFLVLVMKQLHFKCCDWFYIKSYPPHRGDHANSSHVTHVYHTYTLMAHWPFYCSLLQDTNIKHICFCVTSYRKATCERKTTPHRGYMQISNKWHNGRTSRQRFQFQYADLSHCNFC